jgi:hypothetical protein
MSDVVHAASGDMQITPVDNAPNNNALLEKSPVEESPVEESSVEMPPDEPVVPKLTFFHSLRKHNPFYLLSSASMLLGCLLIVNTMTWEPISLNRLMSLLLTINVYELLLLGLGVYLLKPHDVRATPYRRRDGLQVLTLCVVFMCDAAFLVSEVVSTDLQLGMNLSIGLALLAGVKAVLIVRALGIRFARAQWLVAAACIASMFAMPVVLKAIGDTRVTTSHFVMLWWGVLGLWALHDVVRYHLGQRVMATPGATPQLLLIAIPFISIVSHLGILHYVYDRPFTSAMAAPVLLLIALFIARVPRRQSGDEPGILGLIQLGMVVAAAIVTLRARTELLATLPLVGELTHTHLGLLATYLMCAWLYVPAYFLHASVIGGVSAAAYQFGPSAQQLSEFASMIWRWLAAVESKLSQFMSSAASSIWAFIRVVIPSTASGWGSIAVAGSFVLLAVGARITLRKEHGPSAGDSTRVP